MRNGLNVTVIHDLSLNSPVLVWREGNTGQSGHWDGLFDLLTIEGETCIIKLSSGPTTFRSTVVKPYLQDPQDPQEPEPSTQSPVEATPEPERPAAADTPKRGRGRPRKYPLLTAMADITIYLQDD